MAPLGVVNEGAINAVLRKLRKEVVVAVLIRLSGDIQIAILVVAAVVAVIAVLAVNDVDAEPRDAQHELMPLRKERPAAHGVVMYRGREGARRHLRDILRIGADVYFIGGADAWFFEECSPAVADCVHELERSSVKFYPLLHAAARERAPSLPPYLAGECRFLPEGFLLPASTTVFGGQVTFHAGNASSGCVFTVLIDEALAESMRRWMRLMWNSFPPGQKEKRRRR
jgi:hypothetical protein